MSRSIFFGRRKKRNSWKQTQVPRLLQITSTDLCFWLLLAWNVKCLHPWLWLGIRSCHLALSLGVKTDESASKMKASLPGCYLHSCWIPAEVTKGYTHLRPWKVKVLITQLCLTLCSPMDYSPSGSSVHGVLQARMLEWVAMVFSKGSSWLRDQTRVYWACKKWKVRTSLGGLVVMTLGSHFRGHRFDPLAEELRSCMLHGMAKNK